MYPEEDDYESHHPDGPALPSSYGIDLAFRRPQAYWSLSCLSGKVPERRSPHPGRIALGENRTTEDSLSVPEIGFLCRLWIMKRRKFLEITAVGALALGVPGAAWRFHSSSVMRFLAQPGLCTMLGDHRVRELGQRYREACPAESTVETLSVAVLGSRRPGQVHGSALRKRLNRQVRDDFDAGRTILLDGWMLSATEARQCALFSLVYS